MCHKDGRFTGLRVKDTVTGSKRMVQGNALIIATGGNSYQSTGSTGDGYRFAKELGHEVTPILPALVPFIVKEEWERELQGSALKMWQLRFQIRIPAKRFTQILGKCFLRTLA